MNTALIRKAIPSDGDAVRAIVFDTLDAYGVDGDPDGLDSDVMTFGRSAPDVLEFVAEVDGTIVGSVIITPHGDGRAKLSKYFVSASQRGFGIGRRLLEHAVNAARDAGLLELELWTRAVFLEAIHLYETTGWQAVPAGNDGPCELAFTLALSR